MAELSLIYARRVHAAKVASDYQIGRLVEVRVSLLLMISCNLDIQTRHESEDMITPLGVSGVTGKALFLTSLLTAVLL